MKYYFLKKITNRLIFSLKILFNNFGILLATKNIFTRRKYFEKIIIRKKKRKDKK